MCFILLVTFHYGYVENIPSDSLRNMRKFTQKMFSQIKPLWNWMSCMQGLCCWKSFVLLNRMWAFYQLSYLNCSFLVGTKLFPSSYWWPNIIICHSNVAVCRVQYILSENLTIYIQKKMNVTAFIVDSHLCVCDIQHNTMGRWVEEVLIRPYLFVKDILFVNGHLYVITD